MIISSTAKLGTKHCVVICLTDSHEQSGNRALHLAAQLGHAKMIEVLVHGGARIETFTNVRARLNSSSQNLWLEMLVAFQRTKRSDLNC